ncbi:SDR family NAD(P)-dependent oxidoreductase, partial [Chloroflexota bacterium]
METINVRGSAQTVYTQSGKTILITGATDGIGLVSALELARQGATIILHGRNPQKIQVAKDHILGQIGYARIEPVQADLAELVQVKRMASEIQERYKRLDIMINNAGAMFFRRR